MEKSWNLKAQKEHEPCINSQKIRKFCVWEGMVAIVFKTKNKYTSFFYC